MKRKIFTVDTPRAEGNKYITPVSQVDCDHDFDYHRRYEGSRLTKKCAHCGIIKTVLTNK